MSEIGVIQIIDKYLRKNGFDGLYNDECGCELDDLAPCESMPNECKPGYKTKTPDGDEEEWIITPQKPSIPYSERD
ncbi:unnamed protein product [marine sediment metagenome]|uniref:Uncharacterized protein n=1 Tax=marine sediment metagenome TaxID=412755 RepID=X1KQU5_9ZZZZ